MTKYSYLHVKYYDTYQNLIFRIDIAYILGSLKLNDTVHIV